MDNSFSQLVESASSILVLLPVKPSFDNVAAGLALYLSLHDQKQVAISCPSPMMVGFSRLVGVNKITSELGNKNLTIKFKGYDAANIDKVSYDIVNGEFNLTVAPKAGFAAPQREEVDFNYSGVSADLIILIGGANDNNFPLLESGELKSAKIAHIGTRTLVSNREIMSFAGAGASVSELVARVIKENNLPMDPDIASNLVMGIEEGSSNFASSEVTPETFEIFAHLLRSGGQRQARVKLSPANFPPGAVPTVPFSRQRIKQTPQMPVQFPQELDVQDIEGTQEAEQDINPPDDWLQPKVFKSGGVNQNMPDSFSENKG